MKERVLVVKADTPFCDAIKAVHKRKKATFAVESQGEIYIVAADSVIEQALQKALTEKPNNPVPQQFKILRNLYRCNEPVLKALRSYQIWPRRLLLADAQRSNAPARIREVKPPRRWSMGDELVVPSEIAIQPPLEMPRSEASEAEIVFPQELKFFGSDEGNGGDSTFRGSGENVLQVNLAYFYVWQCLSNLHTEPGVGPNPGLCPKGKTYRRVKIPL
jgi:hypothetical protein